MIVHIPAHQINGLDIGAGDDFSGFWLGIGDLQISFETVADMQRFVAKICEAVGDMSKKKEAKQTARRTS